MAWLLLPFSPSPCGEGTVSLARESESAVCSQAICSGVNGGAWDDIVEGTVKTGTQHTAALLTGTYDKPVLLAQTRSSQSARKHTAHKYAAAPD